MSILQKLTEQTVFLLEKQKEANKDCMAIFAGLLDTIKSKLQQQKVDSGERAALEQVHALISEQSETIKEDAQVDIDFLTEQLQALNQVKTVEAKDPIKAKELLAMLVDENEEVKETEAFKKEVNDEAAASKENLMTMVTDIKEAISEGNAEEVAQYLESILSSEGADVCCDDEECDDEECGDDDDDMDGEEAEGGCGSCNGCSGGGCGSGCGSDDSKGKVDIFADLERYEQHLHGKGSDDDDKTQH